MEQSKASVRRALKRLRDEMPEEQRAAADARIAQAVIALPAFERSRLLFAYCPCGAEVDVRTVVDRAQALGKRVALPRVTGPGAMAWHEAAAWERLAPSALGIPEPSADEPEVVLSKEAGSHPLALVPGLGFDGQGFRLGYGGGFYDRFLPALKAAGGVAVGVCREACFASGGLPREGHDVPVDVVITEVGERFRRHA